MRKSFYPICLALLLTLLLAGCSFTKMKIPKATPTPISEQPAAAMPAQPAQGIAGGNTIGDAYMPELGNTGYDVERYDLALAFSNNLDMITATMTITSTSRLENLGRISLDFISYEVDSVYLGEDSAAYYRDDQKLYIDLPRPVKLDGKFSLRVNYHGRVMPQRSDYIPFTLGLRQPVGKHLSAFAEPDGARAWFPCNDHPLDKAAFIVKATVPAGLTAVSNGTLLDTRVRDGKTTFIWENNEPMATYLLTLAVGRYQRIDSPPVGRVDIRHYVFAEQAENLQLLDVTDDLVQFYSDLIGPYPFHALGVVEVDVPGLGMETQTMIMLSSGILRSEDSAATLAHEIVHHWFGDSLSPASWKDIWLNEGFATYFEILWTARNGDPAQELGRIEPYILKDQAASQDALNNPAPENMFGTNTYLKGAWVLYMLHEEFGDELFYRIIRTYYERYAYHNASTADFQAVVEELSGKDLDGFFEQWVASPGNPNLSLAWVVEGEEVNLQVCQLQDGKPFTMPLEITFFSPDGETFTKILQIDERQEQVTLAIPFDSPRLEVDPGQKILAEVQTRPADRLTACGE